MEKELEVLLSVHRGYTRQDFGLSGDEAEYWAKDKCIEAMKKYSQFIATDFVEWMQDEKYEKAPNGFYSNRSPEAGGQTWFNLSELLDKYLNKD